MKPPKRLYKSDNACKLEEPAKKLRNVRQKPLEFQVRDPVMLKVSPQKGVIRFGKRGKLNPQYIRPFKILKKVGPVAYKLKLPKELSNIHNTFHFSNLKKRLSDESLFISMKEIRLDDKLNFVEEPVEIMDREVNQLRQSQLYGAIRNVNLNHQQGHLKALEMNLNFILTYSLFGFLLSFKKSLEDVPGPSISHSKIRRIMGNYFLRSTDFFKMYTPRAPPVEYGANKDPVNELVDALDDLDDENGVVEVEKDLSEDDGLKVQMLKAKYKWLAEQRRIRFHKMKEQENDMKSSYFSNSTHLKLAMEKYTTNKRKFDNVLRPPVDEDTYVKVLSIDTLKKKNNVLD
nr:putative reverse transcriptase domain-containing protein [Tanacetum cinerariifolium]